MFEDDEELIPEEEWLATQNKDTDVQFHLLLMMRN